MEGWFAAINNGDSLDRITATIDPLNKLYVVGFASTSSDYADMILVYHWPTGEWSKARVSHEFLAPALTQVGYTVDTMDLVSATVDELTYPVDSRFWSGQARLLLAGFDRDHKHGFFAGANLEARVEMGDAQMTPGRKTMIRGVRPIIEGNMVTPSIRVGYRNRMQDVLQWSADVDANALGFCPVRSNARYQRVRVTVPAGSSWDIMRGLDEIKASPMGAR